MFYTNSVSHQTRNVNKNIKLGGDIFMDEKNSYTREDVLEVLVKENRKFREEIMVILYKLIFGLCITTFIMVLGFVSVTYIQIQYGIHNSYNIYTLYIYIELYCHS